MGEASLRYALPTVVLPAAAAAALFWRSSQHLRDEMAPLHETHGAEEAAAADPPIPAAAPSR